MKTVKKQARTRARNRALGPEFEYRSAEDVQRPTHDAIAQRAYDIWHRHGCPEGTAFHDWLAAEAELRELHHHGRH